MNTAILYGLTGIIIFIFGLKGLFVYQHLLRKVLAVNVMGTGIFIFLIALANRGEAGSAPDPIPHAMVLTGIVVAVSATAFILALIVRLHDVTGRISFEDIYKDMKDGKQ